MRRWLHAFVPLILLAPNLEAQEIPPSRFSAATAARASSSQEELSPGPPMCRRSKGVTIMRGAVGGFVGVAVIGWGIVFVQTYIAIATWRSSAQELPLLEAAAVGALVFALLEAAEWERQCG
jgi:hypothetical protein